MTTSVPTTDFMAEGDPGQEEAVAGRSAPASAPERWYEVVWSSKKARVGIILLALYVLVAIFAPLIAPLRPDGLQLRAARRPERRATGSAPTPQGRTSPPS